MIYHNVTEHNRTEHNITSHHIIQHSCLLTLTLTLMLALCISIISRTVHLFFIVRYSINRSGYWDHTISDDEWAKHVETLDLQNVISAANANYEYKKVSSRE